MTPHLAFGRSIRPPNAPERGAVLPLRVASDNFFFPPPPSGTRSPLLSLLRTLSDSSLFLPPKGVRVALDRWWSVLPSKTDEGRLTREQYLLLNFRIQKALDRRFVGPDAGTASDDWLWDVGEAAAAAGEQSMSRRVFLSAMFELADVWCETVLADEYIDFLDL